MYNTIVKWKLNLFLCFVVYCSSCLLRHPILIYKSIVKRRVNLFSCFLVYRSSFLFVFPCCLSWNKYTCASRCPLGCFLELFWPWDEVLISRLIFVFLSVVWSWSAEGWECCAAGYGSWSHCGLDLNLRFQGFNKRNDLCQATQRLWE